ncbi:MAG: DUF4241 domain-containing protein [Stenomitos rutilans HA7619-LM2]|jgi:hypothetical protein|nr:DUF4241 domain-containing protein [Stenomitos rutilans HA7619-LM2]
MNADVTTILDDSIYAEEESILIYQLQNLLEVNQTFTCSWANMCLDNETQANVIAFSSGWGDGIYPTYFGFNESGEVVSVITDFGVCPKSLLQV